MADNIATAEHTSNPLLAPIEPDHNRLKQARGKWNGKWRPLLQKGWYWALGSFIRCGHEGIQQRNSGDGTAERCSQRLAALTLAVVSNDQLLATAKWHCVVRNTSNCWRWTLGDPRISACCRARDERNVNSQEEVLYLERRNSITTCDVSQRSPVRPSDKRRIHVIMSHWGNRDSSVGIATRYGLDGPGIESRWGRDFPHPSRTTWGSPSLLYTGYRVFPGDKAARTWCWPPSPI